MRMQSFIATIIITFLLTTTASFAANRLVLSDKSYGLVTFGSELKQIEEKLGEKATGDTGDKGCDDVNFRSIPGISFMVENGMVTRADVRSPQIENVLKIKLGTSLAEVKRRYPDVGQLALHEALRL